MVGPRNKNKVLHSKVHLLPLISATREENNDPTNPPKLKIDVTNPNFPSFIGMQGTRELSSCGIVPFGRSSHDITLLGVLSSPIYLNRVENFLKKKTNLIEPLITR